MTTMDEHAEDPATLGAAGDDFTLSASSHDQLVSALVAAQKLAADEVRQRLSVEAANRALQQQVETLQSTLSTLRASKTFRFTRGMRRAYGRIRAHRRGRS